MISRHTSARDAADLMASGERTARAARRVRRWFRVFVVLQSLNALAFTLSIDVAGVDYWRALAPFLLATSCLWLLAVMQRTALPRHGLRNMGIALASWFVLYFLMLDPAVQLLSLTSPWWRVVAGIVSVSPTLACWFASSRR